MSAETPTQRIARIANALIPLYGERSEVREVLEGVGTLAADARLGAALRETLATVPDGEELTISATRVTVALIDEAYRTRTDATRALASLLSSRSTPEHGQ